MNDLNNLPQATQLNPGQESALADILSWLSDPGDNMPWAYVFGGPAGTGKTFTVTELKNRIKGRVVFTAPTNKATKVLRDTLTTKDYKPETRTIYSLLGLKMEANGEVKELVGSRKDDDEVDLSLYKLVVVDEGGMVNRELRKYCQAASERSGTPFLFMGDQYQLPPVGEIVSPIWTMGAPASHLTKVMRHDNQILALATDLRKQIDHPLPSFKPKSDNDNDQGVWALTMAQMGQFVADSAMLGEFQAGTAKVIAWRNATVDRWNKAIRKQMFEDVSIPWYAGERVIFTSPAKDLEDQIVATTDDEGIVMSVSEDWHPVYREFAVHRVSVTLDGSNSVIVARVLHPSALGAFTRRSEELAEAARNDKRQWKQFWEFKESFHSLRHAYAITAHRSQGSTYQRVFVEYKDILVNRTRKEAFQCLYVACTRAKRELYLA